MKTKKMVPKPTLVIDTSGGEMPDPKKKSKVSKDDVRAAFLPKKPIPKGIKKEQHRR